MNVFVQCSRILTSCVITVVSLEPVANCVPFHAKAPTLASWPFNVLTFLALDASQICTSALFVPTAMCFPSGAQWNQLGLHKQRARLAGRSLSSSKSGSSIVAPSPLRLSTVYFGDGRGISNQPEVGVP